MGATAMDRFIEQGWNDHVNDAAGVAARLAQARPLLDAEPEKAADFARLAEHVLLGHLGDAAAMAPWLERLAPIAEQRAELAPTLERARAACALLRGEAPAADRITLPALIQAHGTAACGFAARGDAAQARRLLQSAATLAGDAQGDALATKALAASCNNLASQLLDGAREPAADALMMETAALSRDTWATVGSWLNAERAEYLLALCAAAIGDGAKAAAHAGACAAICEANAADAFERFFAQEAMARAMLAQADRAAAGTALSCMRELIQGIDDEANRAYAQDVLAKTATAV